MSSQISINEKAANEFVIPIFKKFCTDNNFPENFESLSEKDRRKVMDLFNRKVPKYHLFQNQVIELNLGYATGDIDFKIFTLEEFVHKTSKFEEATELYISRKDSESRVWIVITVILLISLFVVWMV